MSKITVHTPILSPHIDRQISTALTMFSHSKEWKALGLDTIRKQGAVLLFYGEPGTGKTTEARHIARSLRTPLREIDFADVGSSEPGEIARQIRGLFTIEADRKKPIIFLDECEMLLLSRDSLGGDMLWLLEPINATLKAIDRYEGLVILATNREPETLDHSLERRLLAKVRFERPDKATRRLLWRSKMPEAIQALAGPLDACIDDLASHDLTGAEIETVILRWAGWHIQRKIAPVYLGLEIVIQNLMDERNA